MVRNKAFDTKSAQRSAPAQKTILLEVSNSDMKMLCLDAGCIITRQGTETSRRWCLDVMGSDLDYRFLNGLDAQADTALLVDLQHLHAHQFTFFELVADILDALVGNL